MTKNKSRMVAAGSVFTLVAAAVGISIIGGGAADAQEAADAVPTALAPANSVNSASIIAGQVYQSDINPAVVNVLRTPGKDSVTGWTVKDGTITEPDLSAAVKTKLALHAKDGVDGKDGAQGIQGEKGKNGINAVNNLLYVTDGAKHVHSLTYKLDTPVSVKDFQTTFFQERVYGNGTTGVNVILGVDANDDGNHEGNDLKWQMGGLESGRSERRPGASDGWHQPEHRQGRHLGREPVVRVEG